VLTHPAIMHKHNFYVMEVWIKTLTGASLQLLVSPFDSVYNVKFRIQKLEGCLCCVMSSCLSFCCVIDSLIIVHLAVTFCQ